MILWSDDAFFGRTFLYDYLFSEKPFERLVINYTNRDALRDKFAKLRSVMNVTDLNFTKEMRQFRIKDLEVTLRVKDPKELFSEDLREYRVRGYTREQEEEVERFVQGIKSKY
jgi:hypothetical protein